MSLRRSVYVAAVATLAVAGLRCQATPIDDVVAQVSQTSYQTYISSLFPTSTSTRYMNDNHDAARNLIQSDFEALGLDTSTFGFTYSGATYYDVIGVLPGTTTPDNYYLVGAHFDSVSGSPGADDNASGVAGVLEAARVLSQYAFEDSIIFVAFDREEQGLYGSTALANNWASLYPGGSLLGMISLDMIGYNYQGSDSARIYTVGGGANSVSDALEDALTTYGGLTYAGLGSSSRSDHAPFHNRGWAAAMLIEGGWQSNPYYHRSTDVLANLDYAFATNMTRATVGYLATEAGLALPEPATWLLAVCAFAALAAARRRIVSPRLR